MAGAGLHDAQYGGTVKSESWQFVVYSQHETFSGCLSILDIEDFKSTSLI